MQPATVRIPYPTGLHGPVGAFGLIMQRYQHLYGLNDAALAKLAVTQRNHGLLNPNACDKLRVPLTEQDYLQSKRVSTPLRLLDSVLVCEGANGVLLTSDDNARRLGLEMKAFPTGYAEQTHYNLTEPLAEITEFGIPLGRAARISPSRSDPEGYCLVPSL